MNVKPPRDSWPLLIDAAAFEIVNRAASGSDCEQIAMELHAIAKALCRDWHGPLCAALRNCINASTSQARVRAFESARAVLDLAEGLEVTNAHP